MTKKNSINQLIGLIESVREQEGSVDFWKGIMYRLFTPMVIVNSERNIIFQNMVNSSLFKTSVTSKDLCTACREYGKMGECEDCPIDKALIDGSVSEKTMLIEGCCYRQVATPTVTNRGTVVVVLFLPSSECQA